MYISMLNVTITTFSILAFCFFGVGTYDGHPIIAFPYPFGFQINGFLYGTVITHPDIFPMSGEHELIHWEQQKEIGFPRYIAQIALPSMFSYWIVPMGLYYEMPWEKPL